MTTPAAPTSAPSSAPAAAPASPQATSPVAGAGGASSQPQIRKPLPGPPPVPGDRPEAQTEPKPPGQQPPSKRKYKLKIDGADVEEELNDDELVVRLQKGRAAEKRMQQAAEVQKQFQEFQALAKSNPELLLKELSGLDPDQWAEQRLAEKWKRDVMPEEQKKLLDLEQRAVAAEKKAKEFEARAQQEMEAKQQARVEQEIEQKFIAAFKTSGLEWTPEHLDMFGKIALDALDYGIDLTPEQMASEVKAELERRETESTTKAKSKIFSLKGNDLLDALGEEVTKEVIRASVAKRQAAQAQPLGQTITPTKTQPKTEETPTFKTQADWRKAFGA